ncbi:MAG: DUF969 domain-containing protein [Alphaproteobacteria bacterium]|nr:DUF969 family protein [Alphaproteobacteria bacterium]MDE2112060.1 DUF969 domain-containing protein [Alphaproteobacteria bacterium]MDE2492444.1 DUF969 domain-containing protein [Alphaproteobacteria bacterium]
MLVLSGVAVVILGFALRFNPLLVVTLAGIVTGLAAGFDPVTVVAMLGKAFVANRFIAVAWLVLPVIGLLERGGIRERARTLIRKMHGATTGRVLTAYFLLRQLTATLGLTSLGGHVQMVRPVIAPMAEAAAERDGPLDDETRDRIRANAAAVDNIAVFFGEDVFIAIGSILLIQGFLGQNGISVTPPRIALWAVPTALLAFAIHNVRLWLLDRRLARRKVAK